MWMLLYTLGTDDQTTAWRIDGGRFCFAPIGRAWVVRTRVADGDAVAAGWLAEAHETISHFTHFHLRPFEITKITKQ